MTKTNTYLYQLVFLALTVFFLVKSSTYAQVGIGTTNPNTTSILDVTSTTQGILVPRQPLKDLLLPRQQIVY